MKLEPEEARLEVRPTADPVIVPIAPVTIEPPNIATDLIKSHAKPKKAVAMFLAVSYHV